MRTRIVLLGIYMVGIALVSCAPSTPIFIIVTATPAPLQLTLTPLPVLPSATPLLSPTAIPPMPISPTALPPTALPPTLPPIPTATPTNTLPPPPPTVSPPPRPTATPVLVQLSVFDQGGGNMAVFIYGGQVGKRMAFRAIACSPNCNNRPDGRDVDQVTFSFFKRTPQGQLKWMYDHTEMNAPYCSFGGSSNCDFLDISNLNAKWPNNQNVVENGDHVLQVDVDGKGGASWHGRVNFRIQR